MFSVLIRRLRYGRRRSQSCGMAKRRVSAVLGMPIRRSPFVVVEITDAGMIGGKPVVRGKGGREYGIHVAVNGNIGI